jgi:hypothetical protein
MTTSTITELVRNGNHLHERADVGERVELARYTIPTGERVVYGQRVNGVVRLVDLPGSGGGRAFLIERELERDGHAALKALVADYLEQARIHQQIPMAENVLSRYLDHLASAERSGGTD